MCMLAKSLQSCPTLCSTMDCTPLGSSVQEILQARILEWVAMPSCRGPSQSRDWTVSLLPPALAGRFLTSSATWSPQQIPYLTIKPQKQDKDTYYYSYNSTSLGSPGQSNRTRRRKKEKQFDGSESMQLTLLSRGLFTFQTFIEHPSCARMGS